MARPVSLVKFSGRASVLVGCAEQGVQRALDCLDIALELLYTWPFFLPHVHGKQSRATSRDKDGVQDTLYSALLEQPDVGSVSRRVSQV